MMNQVNSDRRLRRLIIGSFILFGFFLILSIFIINDGATSVAINSFDKTVQFFVSNYALTEQQAAFFVFITQLANPIPLAAFSLVIAAWLIIVHHRRLAAFFILILLASGGVSQLYKILIARTRPADVLYAVAHYGFAFPSAHALASILFYGFLGFCLVHASQNTVVKILISLITVSLIFLIGLSRIVLGVHWFSDVVGGYLIGGALLCVTIAIYYSVVRIVTNTTIQT